MLTANFNQRPEVVDQINTYWTPSLELVVPDIKMYKLLADLSPDTPWGERKIAAHRLGSMRSPEALPGLLDALPADPFWMVRCAIIQALEMIGDSGAIPTLREIANSDGFYIVRSHAAKAIERLSQKVQEPI
jgi:HEAT repeat protein